MVKWRDRPARIPVKASRKPLSASGKKIIPEAEMKGIYRKTDARKGSEVGNP